MEIMRILFIGGDARMRYAARKLSENSETVTFSEGERPDTVNNIDIFDAVVLPLPLTKDGKTVFAPSEHSPMSFDMLFETLRLFADEHTVILAGGESPALTEFCAELGCRLVNYFTYEPLTLRNAALTAEAALCLLSQSGDGALLDSAALITGSGRIAFFLAERLKACGAAVTLAARNKDKRELARLGGYEVISLDELPDMLSRFDYIANTVPAPLFDETAFAKMRSGAVFQELASLPEQPQSSLAERFGIKYIYAGGLPGKYSPQAAGEYIALAVRELLTVEPR